ncbi:hypothetical protein WR25_09101 isoform A [Diploscapter pachys]|uniref:CHK kinase-like domain-containing protein n=1 Tax=Diploscapter pachys TaxID=2018661 RepID=A0A2A2LQ43_9BILA|nr:hypothetical protein WR25_09101 isoform A [Diploscapter pachys]
MKINSNFTPEMQENLKKIHNLECDVYKLLREHFRSTNLKLQTYALIKFVDEDDDSAYIVMEHVGNLVPTSVCDTLTKSEMEQVLENLALFHSTTCDDEHFGEELFSNNVSGMFRDDLVPLTMKHLQKLTESQEKGDTYGEAAKVLVNLLKAGEMRKFNDKYGRVFCHGDTWQSNILFVNDNGTRKFRAFIDFQTTHTGNPAIDLARLFCGCLTRKDLNDHTDHFLKFYYEKLSAIKQPQFSLEQALIYNFVFCKFLF